MLRGEGGCLAAVAAECWCLTDWIYLVSVDRVLLLELALPEGQVLLLKLLQLLGGHLGGGRERQVGELASVDGLEPSKSQGLIYK